MTEVHTNNSFHRNVDIASLTDHIHTNKNWNRYSSRNINETEKMAENLPLKKRYKVYHENSGNTLNNTMYSNNTCSYDEKSYNNYNNGIQTNKLNHSPYQHNTPNLSSKSNLSKLNNSPSFSSFDNNGFVQSNVNNNYNTQTLNNNEY
ncbi:hypothetical protein H8356DRAFT_873100, partial [Neocallimastix lanati (nom. inval.)]|uniref:Uncharacterized protein n=1 Tax=Neocallimastix californiae TaxID=1754190 RepID=A0A1Y2C384_9FUNG|eukprot:ORY41500.1 hypothetical protein LY90DRAFT_510201 [Neocallimastix californiae]